LRQYRNGTLTRQDLLEIVDSTKGHIWTREFRAEVGAASEALYLIRKGLVMGRNPEYCDCDFSEY